MKLLLTAISTAFISTAAYSHDLTLTKLKISSKDSDNESQSTMELGTRVGFGEELNKIYGEFSYLSDEKKPENGSSVKDTDLKVGGGYLMHFDGLGSSVQPYVGLGGYYQSKEEGENIKTTSLNYKGMLGLKVNMSESTFFILESTLFDHALNKTEKNSANDTSTSESQFGVASTSKLQDVEVGLGISF